MKLLKLNKLLGILAMVGLSTNLFAATYTWTGATGQLESGTGNWSSAPTFTSADSIYFAGYSGVGSQIAQFDSVTTIGSLVFGAETGSAAVSVIGGTNYPLSIAGQTGSTLGLTGDLAAVNVGLLVQAGAGANGIYWSNSGAVAQSRTGLAINLNSASTTFLNNSSNPFYLNARLTGTGALVLRNGSWVINYTSSIDKLASSLSGGITIESGTLEVNTGLSGSSTISNTNSAIGTGALTLGLANSDKDAVFLFTQMLRGNSSDNRFSAESGAINVSDGTGARIIRNNSSTEKQIYSRINLNGNSTLTLDNNNISGASFKISAAGGVSNTNDLATGIRGSGNLYLTGGGLFYTFAGLSVAEDGVRNSFTGTTTVHSGTLQFSGTGGFQATSRIQVDKDGVFDVSQVTHLSGTTYVIGGTYALGAYTYSGTSYAQTLAGTGKVVGNVSFGDYATLHPGGTDTIGRSALTFTNNLTLGNLTIIDLSNTSYGAINVTTAGTGSTGLLIFNGELRLALDADYSSTGTYDLFSATTYSGDLSKFALYLDTTFLENLTKAGEIWSGIYNNTLYSFDESTGVLEVAAVPEPKSMVLLGLGALLAIRRFRRTQLA